MPENPNTRLGSPYDPDLLVACCRWIKPFGSRRCTCVASLNLSPAFYPSTPSSTKDTELAGKIYAMIDNARFPFHGLLG